MSIDGENTVIKTKKPLRKLRFGITLKLSLFVVIIQLIVLFFVGYVYLSKEGKILENGIKLQVSSMMSAFKNRLSRTANTIENATIRNIMDTRPQRTIRVPATAGTVFIELNDELKGFTGSSLEDEADTSRFKVSEIMLLSDQGFVISHSLDDRWKMQHDIFKNRPLSSLNFISDEELNRLNMQVFDNVTGNMVRKNINGIEYFQSAFPVYSYDKATYINKPGLIDVVDNFKLVYKNYLNGRFFESFTPNPEIIDALKSIDKISSRIYLFMEVGQIDGAPVFLTKLGDALLKERLITSYEINILRDISDKTLRYIKRIWFYSVIFRDDINSVVKHINISIEKKYFKKFSREIKAYLRPFFNTLRASIETGDKEKITADFQEYLKLAEVKFNKFLHNLPSYTSLVNLEKYIKMFNKGLGEDGRYKSGIEPYDKYFNDFRQYVVKSLNIISEHERANNSRGAFPKQALINLLEASILELSDKIPAKLRDNVLLPIKLSLEKYTSNKLSSSVMNVNDLYAACRIFKNINLRFSSKRVVDMNRTITALYKHSTPEFIKMLAKLRDKKVRDEFKARQARYMARFGRRRPSTSSAVSTNPPKKGWDKVVEDIKENKFFSKTIQIIGKIKPDSLSKRDLDSLPFYASLFMIKQFWRSFSSFDKVGVLKNNYTDSDRKNFKYINHRIAYIRLLTPYLHENIIKYLYKRESFFPYPSEAYRAMHPFSVEDIAMVYPYVGAARDFINDFDKAIKTGIWKKALIKKDGAYKIRKDFIKGLCVSMMHKNKLGYIVLRVRKNKYDTYLRKSRNTTIDYSVSILLRTIFLSIIFSGLFLRSLRLLTRSADEIGRGNLNKVILLRGSDEFGQLADTLNNMTNNLRLAQGDLVTKARMEEELKLAQEIQATLLPEELPSIDGFSFAGYYVAQTETGGDYYDFLTNIGKSHLGIVVADVSGHGVGAGLVMTMVRSVIRSQAIGIGRAANVIKKINPFIYRDTTSKMYATLWYGVLNSETKVLNYSIAGHNPAIIYNPVKKTFGLLKTGGMAVGVVDNDIFADSVESHAVQLGKGDIFIQYTDGVTEAMNANQDEYGEDRFYDCIKKLGDIPADKIVEEIVNDIQKFTGGIEQSDDITMVVMKVEK